MFNFFEIVKCMQLPRLLASAFAPVDELVETNPKLRRPVVGPFLINT